MKLLVALGLIAILLTVGVLCYLAGAWAAARSEAAKALRTSGMPRNAGKLLRDSMKFINSLISLTELDGDFGETRLSDKDRERANDLVDRYRKETSQL